MDAGNVITGSVEEADPAARLRRGLTRSKKGAQGLADAVPVSAQISHHSARLVGESTIGFFTNARKSLRAELATDLFYDIDGPTIHYDMYNIEVEALGGFASLEPLEGRTCSTVLPWRVAALIGLKDMLTRIIETAFSIL